MNNIFYLLFTYGVSMIITQSKIFKPIREFKYFKGTKIETLLKCIMCTSFWVGVITASLNPLYEQYNPYVMMVMNGFYVSCFCWLVYCINSAIIKDLEL